VLEARYGNNGRRLSLSKALRSVVYVRRIIVCKRYRSSNKANRTFYDPEKPCNPDSKTLGGFSPKPDFSPPGRVCSHEHGRGIIS